MNNVKAEPRHLPGSTIKPLVKLPRDPRDCWQWLGQLSTNGYGRKQWHGQPYLAHRWIWMQLFGPIPDHLPLVNTCGNNACVSPHHWALGTPENRAENHEAFILTAGDVVEIKRVPKQDRDSPAKRAALAHHFARQFGCQPRLIYDIWAGRAWKRKPANKRRPTRPHPEADPDAAATTRRCYL